MDLDCIPFPILYAMVKSSPNLETLIVKAKSNNHTTNGLPLPIGGITGPTLMHKDTRLSGMGGLTKPLPFTSWLEIKALVDLDGIAFPILYPIGNSEALIFLYSYNLSRI